MRVVVIAVPLAVLLSAGPSFAQAAAGQQRPAQPAPQGQRPAPPAPQGQRPAQPVAPAAPAQVVPPPQPPAPFPQGAKIALVNLQQIASVSADGKAATNKVNALVQRKQTELATKQKALQDNQTKLDQSGALMNEAARTQLQKEIERQTVEVQRLQQDAQQEINELQMELQAEFQRKLFPILEQLRKEKDIHILLSAADAGVISIEPGIDLTAEAIKRLDAGAVPAGAAAPPAAAPAPAPAAPPTAAPAPTTPKP